MEQPFETTADAVTTPDVPAQVIRRSPLRAALVPAALIAAAGIILWVAFGREPTHTGTESAAATAPRPTGAPLRAPRPAAPSGDRANGNAAANEAATSKPAVLKIEPVADGEYAQVPFDALAGFDYDPYLLLDAAAEGEKAPEQIPPAIKALDNRRVAIQGFMMPVQMVKENVTYFLLVRSQLQCCFGVAVGMNEWVYITMKEGTQARYIADVPVMIYGTLHVGEELRDGMVMSIYRMDGEKLVARGGF